MVKTSNPIHHPSTPLVGVPSRRESTKRHTPEHSRFERALGRERSVVLRDVKGDADSRWILAHQKVASAVPHAFV